jgi:hypothetical protein
MKLKRALATGAAIVIAGFSLTACGDDGGGGGGGAGGGGGGEDAGDAPDNASTDEFCKVWNDDTIGGDAGDDPDAQAEAAHKAADALAEVGTPEGMDESERNGFEVFVEFLAEVDGEDIEKFAQADPTDEDSFANSLGIDKDDADDVIKFITFASQECMELPSDLPSDIPSE